MILGYFNEAIPDNLGIVLNIYTPSKLCLCGVGGIVFSPCPSVRANIKD